MSYAGFKSTYPIGTAIVTVQGVSNPYGVQCVNVPRAYAAYLYPNIPFAQTISSGDARTLFANANPQYFQKIANNPSDPNQLPEQGDVMVFDATPKAGYSNQFINPDGHTGLYDSGDSNSYNLLQVNAPNEGQGVNITNYAWNYRPCIGWLRPKGVDAVTAVITQEAVIALCNAVTGRSPASDAEEKYIGQPATQENLDGLITYFAALSRIPALEAALKQGPTRPAVLDYINANLK